MAQQLGWHLLVLHQWKEVRFVSIVSLVSAIHSPRHSRKRSRHVPLLLARVSTVLQIRVSIYRERNNFILTGLSPFMLVK